MASWVIVGALVGYVLLRVMAGYPPVPRALRRLWRPEAAFVAAAADAVSPPGGGVTPSGIGAGIPSLSDHNKAAVDRLFDIVEDVAILLTFHMLI